MAVLSVLKAEAQVVDADCADRRLLDVTAVASGSRVLALVSAAVTALADSEVGMEVLEICCTHPPSTDRYHGEIASVDPVGRLCSQERFAQRAEAGLRWVLGSLAFAVVVEVFSDRH